MNTPDQMNEALSSGHNALTESNRHLAKLEGLLGQAGETVRQGTPNPTLLAELRGSAIETAHALESAAAHYENIASHLRKFSDELT